jgi:hypothetical protein
MMNVYVTGPDQMDFLVSVANALSDLILRRIPKLAELRKPVKFGYGINEHVVTDGFSARAIALGFSSVDRDLASERPCCKVRCRFGVSTLGHYVWTRVREYVTDD